MAYKALYRIYRPQTFDEVVGQKYILQTIKNAINNNKIAHAYLFSGPRGTGKTTLAKLLAKGVNCIAETNRPCNECDNCRSITSGTNPDVIEIDAASNNGVDEIRDIIDKVKYAPISGKYKIYIIDEVHMLSTGAFNALLKTLEEPPAHVIFVLATTEVHKVLPTIISRCQRFDFNKVSQTDIKIRIKEILENENIKYTPEVVSLIAELADGGVRDALGILDQTIAYAGDNLTPEHVRDIYGVVSSAEIIELIQLIKDKQVKELISKINTFDLQGVDLVRLTYGILNVIKEIILFNNNNDISGLELLTKEQVESVSSQITNQLGFKIIDILLETIANFKKVNSTKTLLELAFLKLANNNDVVEEIKVKKSDNIPIEISKPVIPIKKELVDEVKDKLNKDQAKQEIKEAQQVVSQASVTELMEDQQTDLTITEEKNNLAEQAISFNESDLMNVLVQATKEDKENASSRWDLINQYMTKPQFSVAASLVIDGIVLAASENGLIIGYQLAPQARAANKLSNYKLITSFFEELFGKSMVYYSITDEEFRALRIAYINQKSLNTLPEPKPIKMPEFIEIKEPETVDKDTQKAIELGIATFGDKFKVKE